jgi:hypothetical protein
MSGGTDAIDRDAVSRRVPLHAVVALLARFFGPLDGSLYRPGTVFRHSSRQKVVVWQRDNSRCQRENSAFSQRAVNFFGFCWGLGKSILRVCHRTLCFPDRYGIGLFRDWLLR